MMEDFQSFLSDKREGYILLEKGKISTFDLPHFLPVKLCQGRESKDSQVSTLWLDNANYFDPYEISEISRYHDVKPEDVLRSIYVSRSFTCHQTSSSILEKLWNALDEHRPDLVVITGLQSIFLRSNISHREARKVWKPVLQKLKEFESRREDLLLTLESSGEIENDFVSSDLVKLADVVLKVEGDEKDPDLECEKGFSGWSKLFDSSFSNENSSSDFVKLEDYVG